MRKEQYGQAREDIVFENNVNYTIQVQLSGYLYEFVAKWGSNLPYYTPGSSPYNIAVDKKDDLVVSYESNWVHKFDADGSFINEWMVKESTTFYNRGITVDRNNYVYVTGWGWRSGINEIRKFDSDGNLVIKWGSGGSGDGQFNFSYGGIAVDNNVYVFVADTYNNRIQKFDSDGNFITKWGSPGSDDGRFAWPNDVAVDSVGYVYVADTMNYRIQKFGITDQTENNGEWQIDTSPAAASGVHQFRTIPAPRSQQRDTFRERQPGKN